MSASAVTMSRPGTREHFLAAAGLNDTFYSALEEERMEY